MASSVDVVESRGRQLVARGQAKSTRRLVSAIPLRSCDLFGWGAADEVLALHQAAWKGARGHVADHDVVRQRAEQRNPAADQHGDARDDEALDQPRFEE